MLSNTVEREKLRLERQRLDLEYQKVQIEKDKALVELQKVRLTLLSIGGAIFAALLALVGTVAAQYVQSKTQHEVRVFDSESQFQLKAAELVLSAHSAEQARANAAALQALFPARLPTDFADRFPSNIPAFGQDIVQAKMDLLKLLISLPPNRHKPVVELWCKLFPEDGTFKCTS